MYTCGINIGKDCENLIMSFVVDKKFKKCMDKIELIEYRITIDNDFIQPVIFSSRDNVQYIIDMNIKQLAYFTIPITDANEVNLIW